MQQHQQTARSTASLPWAAAIKAAEHQQQLQQLHNAVASQSAAAAAAMAANAYEARSSAMGSWCSPEASSSHRSVWGGETSLKGDGVPDDGTAIWGNPSFKKTGVDWTEKESLMNPPQISSNNLEKRVPKPEPTISSINGTEAWGAPPASGPNNSLKSATNSQQQSNLSDNSGNTYVTKTTTTINNEPLGWGESSSLQGNNESSSPPTNSIWNNLASNGKQKSTTDWLSSSSSTASSSATSAALTSSRIDELNKQLESTSIFDSIATSSLVKAGAQTSSTMTNNHLKYGDHSAAVGSSSNNLIGAGAIGGGLIGGNSINDLKQMGANFSNDLLDASSRSAAISALSSSSSSSAVAAAANNSQQSQMNTYNLGIAPSRDLLKQMVHQIQLAVQAGHLNAQILNQPMSTPTLQLVYTLLQQIRMLQQLQDIQQRTVSKTNDINPAPNNLDLQVNRVQQNISLLQKAITQQQAALTKNESLVDNKNTNQQQQAANNFSYANISKLSTNMKVPPSNISNLISNNSIDSFKRSSLTDTLAGNSNSDSQRSAQAIEANATIDKNLGPMLQAAAMNNRVQTIGSGHGPNQQQQQQQSQQQQQAQKSGLLSAQTSSSSSSSASTAAWLAFNSSDLVSSGWNRISSNVSHQDQQFNSDMMSEYSGARGWRDSSLLSEGKEAAAGSLAPGSNVNIARPNSAANNLKQMSETNDILSKNQSSFYDWGNDSDSPKRSFDSDAVPGSSFSPSAIGGLSTQSNPWLFAPTSTSLNASGLNNLIGKSNNIGGHLGKVDNGSSDKMSSDALNFLRSASAASNAQQRSSASLYNDWGSIDSSSLQFGSENNPIGSKPTGGAGLAASSKLGTQGARPAPPPGILGGFGPSSSMFGGDGGASDRKTAGDNSLQARDSTASLWNGAWLD